MSEFSIPFDFLAAPKNLEPKLTMSK